MSKFKVGDKVRIIKPNDTEEYPSWTRGMEKYNNQVITIESFDSIQSSLIKHEGWSFLESWLVLEKQIVSTVDSKGLLYRIDALLSIIKG